MKASSVLDRRTAPARQAAGFDDPAQVGVLKNWVLSWSENSETPPVRCCRCWSRRHGVERAFRSADASSTVDPRGPVGALRLSGVCGVPVARIRDVRRGLARDLLHGCSGSQTGRSSFGQLEIRIAWRHAGRLCATCGTRLAAPGHRTRESYRNQETAGCRKQQHHDHNCENRIVYATSLVIDCRC